MTPREVGIRWFEKVWNQRSEKTIDELMLPTTVGHQEGGPDLVGPADFHGLYATFVGAIPDLKVKILHSVGDDRSACIHWEASGTHQGNFAGIAGSGATVQFRGMTLMIVKDDKIIEGWDSWNLGGFLQRLALSKTTT